MRMGRWMSVNAMRNRIIINECICKKLEVALIDNKMLE